LLEVVECPEVAKALVRAFPGEIRWFPPCEGLVKRFRDASVRQMLEDGVPAREVAWLFDLTTRAIRKIQPA
jgi:hypothetical protein